MWCYIEACLYSIVSRRCGTMPTEELMLIVAPLIFSSLIPVFFTKDCLLVLRCTRGVAGVRCNLVPSSQAAPGSRSSHVQIIHVDYGTVFWAHFHLLMLTSIHLLTA